MENILKNLNPKQKIAVETIKGPLLILAGPGSGKTQTLACRIAYLVQKGIIPKNILAVTFTNKAAGEMKSRVASLLARHESSRNYAQPIIGTFHAICLRILRKEIQHLDYKKSFIIYDTTDQLSLLKKIIKEQNIDIEKFRPEIVRAKISSFKNELIDWKEAEKTNQGKDDSFEEEVIKIYQKYQTDLKKLNALDFDDLIMLTVTLFEKFPKILNKYQEEFKYILVDEYQDTNTSQYIFIKLLTSSNKKEKNICVVGDDAQSIYQFRGADFQNILNFEKDYPSAKIVILDQNYRSTQNILDTASGIISKNIYQKEKKLWTENPKGSLIVITEAASERAEIESIIEELKKLQQGLDLKLKDCAILYRTNAQSRVIEEKLIQHNIPYRIIGAIKFYQRKEIKDVIAYLRLILLPDDFISQQRVINTPPRGIGLVTQNKIFGPKKVKGFRHEKVEEFNKLLIRAGKIANRKPLTAVLKFILEETNYREYLNTAYGKKSYFDDISEGEVRWQNIQELFSIIKQYDDVPALESPGGLQKFLEDVALFSEEDAKTTQKDTLSLMTLHAAKGLEFSTIFIVGCEDGILPHNQSLLDGMQLEEERRLCYVGITRAKRHLYLSFAQRRTLFGLTQSNPPSRFLNDIPERLIDYRQSFNQADEGNVINF